MAGVLPEYKITVDYEKCKHCKRCMINCTFDAMTYTDRPKPIDENCVACQRCAIMCPQQAITIEKHPGTLPYHYVYNDDTKRAIWMQANTGSALIAGVGTPLPYPRLFDRLVIDACQVTNPSIDPLREPIEIKTFLGKKPEKLEFNDINNNVELKTSVSPQLELETPIMISHMSYGALSFNAFKALAMAAKEVGTIFGSGEGGLPVELYEYGDYIDVEVASGRFGVHADYLDVAASMTIKIGQGAKPGIGGHLPGEKVSQAISQTRMIPKGSDALSPAPHHDIYSIEDLSQLIYALKEATRYKKPVFVKIAAVHNSAAISSGILRAGADGILLDGLTGGTGAAPTAIRDHLGIPIEAAIASVDQRLRDEGIRHWGSIIAMGSIRSAAEVAKAIALGADAIQIGTPVLIAMGCRVCQQCYRGICPWGIATTRPDLTRRLKVQEAAQRVANLIRAWNDELKEILGALGLNSIESLRSNRDRLRAIELTQPTLDVLGVKPAGA
ncbi:glutamate synthase-related protein [Candidatus Borrarchaeum sp.]|uniref:glutamate synthase-related protein n=1 Tax=Candidatus Borrarchaeum sp. TaxID=2846742 RepID=UPI002580F401|nr:glutamate synthase-related protein [Candidatus Borrarchaeum sp.]